MRIKFLVILFIGFSPALYTQNKIISDIIIEGNQKTKIDFITSLLLTIKGQQLDSVRLEKDMVQLKRLPALSHAYYQVNSINESNCIIKVYVEENFTVIPEVNFWTFTNNQFSYRLGVYDYNFLGRNIAFGGFYQFNGFQLRKLGGS